MTKTFRSVPKRCEAEMLDRTGPPMRGSIDRRNLAKHRLAHDVASIFEMSNRLAEMAMSGTPLTEDSVSWFTCRFSDLIGSLMGENLFHLVALENEDPGDTVDRILDGRIHWSYDDGSAVWARVQKSNAVEAETQRFYKEDLLTRIGDVLGPIEPYHEVVIARPPHLRRTPADMAPYPPGFEAPPEMRFKFMREMMGMRSERRHQARKVENVLGAAIAAQAEDADESVNRRDDDS